MTRRRPAPRGNRPAPDATNVSASVEPDAGLFGVTAGPYGVSYQPAQTVAAALSGPQRRDQGHRRATQADPGWLGLAHQTIVDLAASGAIFSAEDVRHLAGEPPSTNLLGVAVRQARLLGLIEAAGTDTANRPAAHGRLLRTWRGRRPSGGGA